MENTIKTLTFKSGTTSSSYGIYFPNKLIVTLKEGTVSYDGSSEISFW